jgi:hypothetical protein
MVSRGIHQFRNSLFSRLPGAAACGAAALAVVLAAGCGPHTLAAGGSHRRAPAEAQAPLPGAQALRLATEQHVTSFTGTFTVRLSGTRAATITGAMRARLEPEPAAYMAATLSRPGHASRTMREIITPHALYLGGGQMFIQRFGKPWVKAPAGSLRQPPRLSIGPVSWYAPRLDQPGSDPLGVAPVFRAAKDVHVTGTAMVDGVQTTRYSGIYQIPLRQAGIHGLKQRLERRLMRDLGWGRMRFSAWIDGRHQLRKLSFRGTLGPERMTVTMNFTSLNGPVAIPLPPPGQVGVAPSGVPDGRLV